VNKFLRIYELAIPRYPKRLKIRSVTSAFLYFSQFNTAKEPSFYAILPFLYAHLSIHFLLLWRNIQKYKFTNPAFKDTLLSMPFSVSKSAANIFRNQSVTETE